MAPRPNPEGWQGGSEDFTTVWQSHGHRVESPGLHFDQDNDPEYEGGELADHDPTILY